MTAVVLPSALLARSTGAPVFSAGVPTTVDGNGQTCTRCHRTFDLNPDRVGYVKVQAFNYKPGEKQNIQVTVYHPEALRWGFQLTARQANDMTKNAGKFTLDPQYRILCSDGPGDGRDVTASSPCPAENQEFITHTQPLTLTGANGMKVFTVEWTAPSADIGDVLFFVSGNAANNNGNNTGDRIYNNGPAGFRIEAEGRTCPNTVRPTLRAAVNAGSRGREVAMNTLIEIYGGNFVAAGTTREARAGDFRNGYPKELACVAVEVAGQRIPLTYVQPDQINAQLPTTLGAGTVQYRVLVNPDRQNQLVSDSGTLTAQNYAPALLTFNGRSVAAANTDGTYAADPSVVQGGRPPKPGEIVSLYATGLGPLEPVWQAGEMPDRASPVRDRVTVTIGGTTLPASEVLYAGAVPGFISGLYQLNVRLPAALSDGDVPVTLSVGGVNSQAGAVLPVRR